MLAGSSRRHIDDSALHFTQFLDGVKMRLDGTSGFLSSCKKQSPFAVLGLGGALTVLWIVLLAWVPVQLIYSMIAVVLRGIPFI